MSTLILSRADVSRYTDALGLLHELREALTRGSAPAIPAELRTAPGPVQLWDPIQSTLLATLEADRLFALRACLVAALATEALTPPEAQRIAVLGDRADASGALKALRLVRSLREVWLCGPQLVQTVVEAAQLQLTLKTPVRAIERAVDAVANAEVVICTGGVPLPDVALWPSVQLSVPSAARFEVSPLPTGVLAKAWRVSEAPGALWGHPVQATLGAVLAGTAVRPVGVNPLFAGTAPPWLDLLAAWHVYLGAQADDGLPRVDFTTQSSKGP